MQNPPSTDSVAHLAAEAGKAPVTDNSMATSKIKIIKAKRKE